MTDADIIVAGAGPAGLAAACLLAREGRSVALIAPPETAPADPRTVALMQPSIRLLAYLGLWPGSLKEQTSPLRRLRLVDDTGSLTTAPTVIFDAAEMGEEAFGWNIPLNLLIPSLAARAAELGVRTVAGEARSAVVADRTIAISLADGSRLAGRVLLAADGRNSVLRAAAGIATTAWEYDQVAIATSFAHSGPHDDISTEYHRKAGPFTTVPMPGRRSALVWMERPARAAALMSLDGPALAREIQIASHGDLGLVSDTGPRRAFPMKGLVARSFARSRTYLIGEAGHVVPPIGAQGLNMSLRDAAQAADLILGHDDPGGDAAMAEYDALRRRDVAPRQQIIDLMNRSLLSGYLAFDASRAAGLSLVARFGPLRRLVMRRGLSPTSGLPYAMR